MAALSRLPHAEASPAAEPAAPDTPPARVRTRLFEPSAVPEAEDAGPAGDEVSFFSVPEESCDCVEIARLVQKEAAVGVPLDRMAVVLRSPRVYGPLLGTALRRAGVAAWFVRGTRAPDPAGRAFLALLACAGERLSARRFSEVRVAGAGAGARSGRGAAGRP